MLDNISCPKCGSRATWFEKDPPHLLHRCYCGFCSFVVRIVDGMILYNRPKIEPDHALPGKHTKIYKCLVHIALNEPIKTGEIAQALNQNIDITSSQVSALEVQGWIEKIEYNPGKRGGSKWRTASLTKKYLGVDDNGFID